MRSLLRNRFFLFLSVCIHPRLTFGFALGWSLKSRKKGLSADDHKCQGEAGEYWIQFAKDYLKEDPAVNFFIFGHRHIMLDMMLSRTARILIAGDWMHYFSYVVWDGETLFMEQFEVE